MEKKEKIAIELQEIDLKINKNKCPNVDTELTTLYCASSIKKKLSNICIFDSSGPLIFIMVENCFYTVL